MFQFRSLGDIKKLLIERGESVSDSDDDLQQQTGRDETVEIRVEPNDDEVRQGGQPAPKRKRYSKEKAGVDGKSDPLPPEFRHLRESERKVNPKFYKACAALAGRDMIWSLL